MFNSLDEKILEHEDILKVKKLFDSTGKENIGTLDEKLIKEVNSDPNKDLRFKLANSYLSNSETEKALLNFLKLYEQNPTWNEEAAKKTFRVFDLLGFNDPMY